MLNIQGYLFIASVKKNEACGKEADNHNFLIKITPAHPQFKKTTGERGCEELINPRSSGQKSLFVFLILFYSIRFQYLILCVKKNNVQR